MKISITIQLFQAQLELDAHKQQLAELQGKGWVKCEEYTKRRIGELTQFISDNS